MELSDKTGIIAKVKNWAQTILLSVYPGQGASTTKIVYLTAGLWGVYSALLMTLGMVAVYIFNGRVDATYAATCGGLWVTVFGFASSAQKHKAKTDAGPQTGN